MVGEQLGNYRLVAEIGRGGMGVVYQAEHVKLGRRVAVKLLRNDVAPDLVERFFNEARAAATLQHPGLVEVFDFGHDESGSAFIVMEYLVGESLAERLERDPRLPIPIACSIARQIASALHVAHENGIVHRDLKPGNLYLVPDDNSPIGVRAKVLDFGIAKLTREREQKTSRTHSGTLIGTPRYMSPEQCKNARDVDGRADIYSLGCILYEMLLGVAPFDYDSWAELVGAHLHEDPPRPTELDKSLPHDVDTLVVRMLEKNPDDRFSSMQELAQTIDALLRRETGSSMRIITPPVGVRRVKHDAGVTDPTLPAIGEVTPSGQRTPPAPLAAPVANPVPWLPIGIGALVVGGLVFGAVMMFDGSRSTPAETAYVVVDHDREPVEAAPAPEPAKPVERVEPAAAAKPAKPLAQTEQLAKTFGKQTRALADCFRAHPGSYGDISARFQIDKTGTVLVAEIVPESVGAAPLGQCLAGVARATAFGAQPNAATFRIPIHARDK